MKKLFLLIAGLAMAAVAAQAQQQITMDASVEMASPTQGFVVVNATIEPGWHLYALNLPEGGPSPTTITFETTGVTLDGPIVPATPAAEHFDATFEINLGWWENNAQFKQAFTVTDPTNAQIVVNTKYMGCNDVTCMPPQEQTFTLQVPEYQAPAQQGCCCCKKAEGGCCKKAEGGCCKKAENGCCKKQ